MNQADPLTRLLRAWQHQPKPDATFCPCVWKRIRSQASSGESAQVVSFWRSLPMGWAAAVAVGTASLLGGTAAYAYDEITRDDRQLAAYFRSIDPVQKSVRHALHNHR